LCCFGFFGYKGGLKIIKANKSEIVEKCCFLKNSCLKIEKINKLNERVHFRKGFLILGHLK